MSSSENENPPRRLAEVIARGRREIERRWLERVERDVARKPDIEATRLRDGLPDYLDALTNLLSRSGSANFQIDAEPSWSTVAREHGITRVRLGFDLNQLIQEFITLRHVIREIATEQGVWTGGVEAVLADTLDAAITAAVGAYVEARDYQVRKKRAEHIGFLIHELRNPLSTATLIAARLRANAGPDRSRLLDTLDQSHTRLRELIDGVLVTEKLEAGKIELRPTTLPVREVIEPAIEAARATAARKGLAFRADYDPNLRVRVDPVLTRSALQNLTDNSAKYTAHGQVEISVEDHDESIEIHVRDTCGGLSPEELRTIFEPFERGNTGQPGTGLGLAIAKRAAEVQGGTLRAESPQQAGGCHFWMTLPSQGEPRREA